MRESCKTDFRGMEGFVCAPVFFTIYIIHLHKCEFDTSKTDTVHDKRWPQQHDEVGRNGCSSKAR